MSDTTIRVSEETRERLKVRKHGGESYENVITRLLDDDRDLLAGFGAWEGTDKLEAFERVHEEHKHQSKERIEAIAQYRNDRSDTDNERTRR
ncbi:MAG TPA: antitoxin VapB family protein [Halococcus sp.]|nr:antitoxin VapB family protein [Halococcus sp.]